MIPARASILAVLFVLMPVCAFADDLATHPAWSSVASDRNAQSVGDVLTVVVYQNTEARNAADNTAGREQSFDGFVRGGSVNETGSLSFDGAYDGHGEVRRSQSFVTQISVVVEEVLPNGDLVVGGQQQLLVNSEHTTVFVRGRVRPADITHNNQVLSTRIADAEISYSGRGFVSRNAEPGILHRLLSLLGLSG